MSDADCQRHRLACVEFVSVVRSENDIYCRSCEPTRFIAKKSLVHIAVFKVVFKFFIRSARPKKTIRERVRKMGFEHILNTTRKFQEVSYKITNFF